MFEKYYFVYIMTNKRHTVLYTGVTSNLLDRDYTHKQKINKKSFTARYNVNKLVYYETFDDIYDAIAREKQIKNLVRRKKIELINSMNPCWKDLSKEL